MGWSSRLRVRLSPGGAEILRLYDTLEGMLNVREAAWLFQAGRTAREIVEIGSYRGKSLCLMGRGAIAAGHATTTRITAIDPHIVGKDNPRFDFHAKDRDTLLAQARGCGVDGMLREMVMTSRDAIAHWDGRPIDLLWVDGDHSYEAAKFDLEAWGKFVRKGGTIAAHDYTKRFPGVIRAWDEAITASAGWGPTRRVRSLVWSIRL
jgi:hypothetical protein